MRGEVVGYGMMRAAVAAALFGVMLVWLPRRVPLAPAPEDTAAAQDERLYPMERVLDRLDRKLALFPQAAGLRGLVAGVRRARTAGASLGEAASIAVREHPEAARLVRGQGREWFEAGLTDFGRDAVLADTPRDAAKARQRLRAMRALAAALGW